MRADALPNLREIPIRGDVVKTLRLGKGWENPRQFCKLMKLSLDRLEEIERGGERVYKKTIMRMAGTLDAEWQALVDWEAIDRNGSGEPHSTRQPNLGKHKMMISQPDETSVESMDVNELVKAFSELANSNGKIVSITVRDGKLEVGLEITDAAALKFAESYFDAPLENSKLISATLLLDYRVAGRHIAGGGYLSKLRVWYDRRYNHFTNYIKYKMNLLKIDDSDLPIYSEYYFYKYKAFEERLFKSIAVGILGKASPEWFRHSGVLRLAVVFSPHHIGRCEVVPIDGKEVQKVDWLNVNRLP